MKLYKMKIWWFYTYACTACCDSYVFVSNHLIVGDLLIYNLSFTGKLFPSVAKIPLWRPANISGSLFSRTLNKVD